MEHFDPKPAACSVMRSMCDDLMAGVHSWRFMNVGNRISDPVVNQIAQVLMRNQHVWRDRWGNLNITHKWVTSDGIVKHWLR
jgi:hypothetical protein